MQSTGPGGELEEAEDEVGEVEEVEEGGEPADTKDVGAFAPPTSCAKGSALREPTEELYPTKPFETQITRLEKP